MKQNQLDRIIRLVKRTGDRFVILDRATDEAVVVMNLDEYEDLLNTTANIENLAEEEMLSRLNSDINRWQEQNEKRHLPQIEYEEEKSEVDEESVEEKDEDEENLANFSQKIEENEILNPEFDHDLNAPLNEDQLPEPQAEPVQYISNAPIAPAEVAVQTANFAEEDLSNLPEGEEEKFYLEPIE